MKKIKRVFLIVLDSCGIGEARDAKDFGDDGANTIKSISNSKEFNIENLLSIGFSHIDGLSYLGDGALKSKVARLCEKSKGKDTTIGHWEIAGVISEKPLPTFPNGFPESILKEFSEIKKICYNCFASLDLACISIDRLFAVVNRGMAVKIRRNSHYRNLTLSH